MDQTAITYPYATLNEISGAAIKTILEDVADNLFNPDPYYQQGGDMVRVGGLTLRASTRPRRWARASATCAWPASRSRPTSNYKVAGWAPVAEEARSANTQPVWDVVEQWLKTKASGGKPGRISDRQVNTPRVVGADGNPGLAR